MGKTELVCACDRMASADGGAREKIMSETRWSNHCDPKDESFFSTSNGISSHHDRPNNWDSSNWKPTTSINMHKRAKKGNPEREKERKREQQVVKRDDIKKTKALPTFPRAKTSTNVQLAALDFLKHKSFSENEDQ